jgi:hypothetical protein
MNLTRRAILAFALIVLAKLGLCVVCVGCQAIDRGGCRVGTLLPPPSPPMIGIAGITPALAQAPPPICAKLRESPPRPGFLSVTERRHSAPALFERRACGSQRTPNHSSPPTKLDASTVARCPRLAHKILDPRTSGSCACTSASAATRCGSNSRCKAGSVGRHFHFR